MIRKKENKIITNHHVKGIKIIHQLTIKTF